jgi:hypothetical protein
MRSAHRATQYASQGFTMKSFAGSFPYLCLCCLLIWHVRQCLTCDWMLCLMPFQYITVCRLSSRWVCPGCCKYLWYLLSTWFWRTVGIIILTSLQRTWVSSANWVEYMSCLLSFFRNASSCWSFAISFTAHGQITSSLLQLACIGSMHGVRCHFMNIIH